MWIVFIPCLYRLFIRDIFFLNSLLCLSCSASSWLVFRNLMASSCCRFNRQTVYVEAFSEMIFRPTSVGFQVYCKFQINVCIRFSRIGLKKLETHGSNTSACGKLFVTLLSLSRIFDIKGSITPWKARYVRYCFDNSCWQFEHSEHWNYDRREKGHELTVGLT